MPAKMGVWATNKINAQLLFEWHKETTFRRFFADLLHTSAPEMLDTNGEIEFLPILSVQFSHVPEEIQWEYQIVLDKNDSREKSLGEILASAKLPYMIARMVENNPHAFTPIPLRFTEDDIPMGTPNDDVSRILFWVNEFPASLRDLDSMVPGIGEMQFTDAFAALINATSISGNIHVEIRVDTRPDEDSNTRQSFDDYAALIDEYEQARRIHSSNNGNSKSLESILNITSLRIKLAEAKNHYSMISKLSAE